MYFDECPSWREAATNLRSALDLAGHDGVPIRLVEVDSPESAEALGFRGSPSIEVDGRDPFEEQGGGVGLSCRIYSTPAGPAGSPSLDQLLAALSL